MGALVPDRLLSRRQGLRPRAAERAASLGLAERVIFTGSRSDAVDVMPQFTVSVLPSLTEGLSNTLIESMAAGVPPSPPRVGGSPEVVDDGVTGLLVPPSQPARMAAAIERLLDAPDLAAALRRPPAAAATRRTSPSIAWCSKTLRLYRRLLEPAARHPAPAALRSRSSVELAR